MRTYFWSRAGKYLLCSQDKGGDENFNIYAVDPAAARPASQAYPPRPDWAEGISTFFTLIISILIA